MAYESSSIDNLLVNACTRLCIDDCMVMHMNYLPVHITWIKCITYASLDYLPINIECIIYLRHNSSSDHCRVVFYNLPPFIYKITVRAFGVIIAANTRHQFTKYKNILRLPGYNIVNMDNIYRVKTGKIHTCHELNYLNAIIIFI
jgi:hypothetical protein